ncbi:hypothetical protein FA13DRAFT_1703748 [Coprinellus micaceus]|uniref:Uncharacterized protein n=1 Tax=Coprinellus micaceus TaxID=71717 RepID=A0A4Y7U0R8_COPMI|nr:hypothetical protein FA13DRAFT_1703748 [Coprinellus micaceus]
MHPIPFTTSHCFVKGIWTRELVSEAFDALRQYLQPHVGQCAKPSCRKHGHFISKFVKAHLKRKFGRDIGHGALQGFLRHARKCEHTPAEIRQAIPEDLRCSLDPTLKGLMAEALALWDTLSLVRQQELGTAKDFVLGFIEDEGEEFSKGAVLKAYRSLRNGRYRQKSWVQRDQGIRQDKPLAANATKYSLSSSVNLLSIRPEASTLCITVPLMVDAWNHTNNELDPPTQCHAVVPNEAPGVLEASNYYSLQSTDSIPYSFVSPFSLL